MMMSSFANSVIHAMSCSQSQMSSCHRAIRLYQRITPWGASPPPPSPPAATARSPRRGRATPSCGEAGCRCQGSVALSLCTTVHLDFIPYSLTHSVHLFLKRQCDRTLVAAARPRRYRHGPRRAPDPQGALSISRNRSVCMALLYMGAQGAERSPTPRLHAAALGRRARSESCCRRCGRPPLSLPAPGRSPSSPPGCSTGDERTSPRLASP
jgi:hypothetical protein